MQAASLLVRAAGTVPGIIFPPGPRTPGQSLPQVCVFLILPPPGSISWARTPLGSKSSRGTTPCPGCQVWLSKGDRVAGVLAFWALGLTTQGPFHSPCLLCAYLHLCLGASWSCSHSDGDINGGIHGFLCRLHIWGGGWWLDPFKEQTQAEESNALGAPQLFTDKTQHHA